MNDDVRISAMGQRCCAAAARVVWGAVALAAALAAGEAAGQSSSLYGDPQARRGITVAESSWTYEQPPEMRQFKVHDQITIIVSEKSVVTSEGQMDRRKNASGSLTLKNWILMDQLGVFPDPQTRGAPKITGEMENKLRSQADLETRDSMTFKIAVSVVEKRPNGYLVLEGRRSIEHNDEKWEQCLTGVVRPEDVLPNNSVQSENVAELRIFKRESGHVRDGYRRGWMLQWLDKYQPF